MRSAECQGERRSANELPLQLRIPHSALRIGGRGRVADLPYRVEKPWGFELIWARTDRYVGKILHIEPGHVLSLQYHNKKDESIYVLAGEIVFGPNPGGGRVAAPLGRGAAGR